MRYSQVKQPVATIAGVNNELEKIANSIDDMVSRKAGDGPNTLDATLDANSQRIINLPEPTTNTEPVRKADFDELGNKLRSDVYTAVRDAEDATVDAISAANSANAAASNANIAADNAYQAIADLESDGYAVISQIESDGHNVISQIESDGQSALDALRVVNAGSFEAGGTITTRNEALLYEVEQTFYRWDGALPKTVPTASTPTSTGGVGAGAWVNVGQAELASALADASDSANRVARMAITANSLKDLANAPRIANRQYSVKGFYAGTDVGGGLFYWDASCDKADHNGGTIIDPVRVTAWDGTQEDLVTLFEASVSGSGCYVRVGYGRYTCPTMFGAIPDNLGIDNADSVEKCLNTKTDGAVMMRPHPGSYVLKRPVVLPDDADLIYFKANKDVEFIADQQIDNPNTRACFYYRGGPLVIDGCIFSGKADGQKVTTATGAANCFWSGGTPITRDTSYIWIKNNKFQHAYGGFDFYRQFDADVLNVIHENNDYEDLVRTGFMLSSSSGENTLGSFISRGNRFKRINRTDEEGFVQPLSIIFGEGKIGTCISEYDFFEDISSVRGNIYCTIFSGCKKPVLLHNEYRQVSNYAPGIVSTDDCRAIEVRQGLGYVRNCKFIDIFPISARGFVSLTGGGWAIDNEVYNDSIDLDSYGDITGNANCIRFRGPAFASGNIMRGYSGFFYCQAREDGDDVRIFGNRYEQTELSRSSSYLANFCSITGYDENRAVEIAVQIKDNSHYGISGKEANFCVVRRGSFDLNISNLDISGNTVDKVGNLCSVSGEDSNLNILSAKLEDNLLTSANRLITTASGIFETVYMDGNDMRNINTMFLSELPGFKVGASNSIDGKPFENFGTVTMEDGTTSVTVDHGLPGNPSLVIISPQYDTGDYTYHAVGPEQFKISRDVGVGETTVRWYVRYKP